MTIIKGELELFLDKDGKERVETIEKVLGEVEYLLGMLNSLLMISSSGSSLAESFERVDVAVCLRETCELVDVLAIDKQIELERSMTELSFMGSEKLLRQAFFNLIENAIKYSPAKSTVQVNLSGDDDGFTLSVEDEGNALTEQEQKCVFEPFVRVSPKGEGAGLGLAIVKWICQVHRLSTSVEAGKLGNKFLIQSQGTRPSS